MTRGLFPGLILAGGLSRRMGSNKAVSLLGGQPLLTHVIQRLRPQVSSIVLNAPAGWAEAFDLPLVPDTRQGHVGPLAGILAGMRHTAAHHPDASHFLTVPADSPFLPGNLASFLGEHLTHDVCIVIAASSGQVHPVFGLWPVAIADDLETWLSNEENRRIRSFLARHQTLGVSFPPIESAIGPIDPFFNVNTPDELSKAESYFQSIEP
jgi:molybdopterin-guanine dinucleotide biosynthesis protein A